MKMPDPETMRVSATLMPFALATILRGGGEAFIVDANGRTHFVAVDEDGEIVTHMRYEGDPGVLVPSLSLAFGNEEDMEAVGLYVTDML